MGKCKVIFCEDNKKSFITSYVNVEIVISLKLVVIKGREAENYHLPQARATTHMIPMAVLALPVVDLNLRG